MNSIAGAIIAGGKSSRFEAGHKGLAMLGGKTLLEHAYARLRNQASLTSEIPEIYLNFPQQQPLITEEFLPRQLVDLPIVYDLLERRDGPLIGVLSCLKVAADQGYDWLQICPCDTPFFPLDLSKQLLDKCQSDNLRLSMARDEMRRQPTLSLWHKSLVSDLEIAVVEEGKSGFKQFLPSINCGQVCWNSENPGASADPFFNINHQQDLVTATHIINNCTTD